MTYELWDIESRNLIDWFEQPDEAVAAVRAYVAEGEASLVSLIVRDAGGAIVVSVTGEALVTWAAKSGDEARRLV